jgi:curved DNA-binding protein CbpA
MDIDYYAILGVPPEAEIEALRLAYRNRAFECHPDLGGSHERMVLVNEAWAILSNPITRSHYDSARRNKDDYEARRSAREDAQAARQQAQKYPRKWPDFEVWLDRLLKDFTEVKYGKAYAGFGMQYPTAGRSVSGWLLLIAGGLFGIYVGSNIIISLSIGHPACYVLGLGFMVGGAWSGVLLHRRIGKFLGKEEKREFYQHYSHENNIITEDQKPKKSEQELREEQERLQDPDGFTLKERQEWEQSLEEERKEKKEKEERLKKQQLANKCPKCGYERKPGDIECPRCGIVYEKYAIYLAKKEMKINGTKENISHKQIEKKKDAWEKDLEKNALKAYKKFKL